MTNYSNFKQRAVNAMVLFFILMVLGVYSCVAQEVQRVNVIGSETSFGMHRFFIDGDRFTFQNLYSFSNGISSGVYAGNKLVTAHLRMGFYSMVAHFPGEMRIFEKDFFVNIYPLEFFRKRENLLDIYFSTGLSFHSFSVRESLNPAYLAVGEVGTPSDKVYQVVGAGIVYLPQYFKQSVSVFSEAHLYTAIDFAGCTESNIFLNIGIRKSLFTLKR